MKKMVSSLLSLSIFFSISVPALAHKGDTPSSDTIILTSNGHGEYTTINATSGTLKSNVKNYGDVIIATATEDTEIYHLRDDQYLVLTNDNNYLLTDKITVNIDDFAANEATFNQYNVSNDLREDMEAVIAAQKILGNDDLEIEVYAPGIISNVIQPLTNEPIGTSYYKYTYDGISFNMKDYTVKYAHLSTGMIEKGGTTALSQAKAWSSFVVSATGAVSKTVTAFGVFSSAYELFKHYKGEVVTGFSSDRIYTNLVYDRLMKDTYVANIYGDYVKGCVSYKVWLNRHDSYQYYGATGLSHSGNHILNSEHYSENFQNPAPTAIQFSINYYVDSFLYTKVFDKTVRLMGT